MNSPRSEMPPANACKIWLSRIQKSNGLAVFIVYVSLMTDSVLLTCVVPILPRYFLENKQTLSFLLNVTGHASLTPRVNTTNIDVDALLSVPANKTNGTLQAENWVKDLLGAENLFIGLLLASKPLVQVFTNIAVGPLCDKFGYDLPMLSGYLIIIASSIIFAFGRSYFVLLTARALQGVGSACVATAGMGKIASRYPDDSERGRMLGIALGGLGLGVVAGPSFGSVTYYFGGMKTPFLILAGLMFCVAILQLCTMQGCVHDRSEKKHVLSATKKLLKDPYIILAALTIFAGNFGIGVTQAGLPIWMMLTMRTEKWMLGVAFLPIGLSYLASTAIFSRVSTSSTRWIVCLVSFLSAALGCVTLPLCKNLPQMIGPGVLIGTAIGMVDSSIFPIAGCLVDLRHNSSAYGSIYAIMDASFCASFIAGPLLTGFFVDKIGFWWLNVIVAMAFLVYAPFVGFLRNPPPLREEQMAILREQE